jgi:cobalamin biosynthesis protein CobT
MDEHSFDISWDADDGAGDQDTLDESATPRPSKAESETLREQGSKGEGESKSDQASREEQEGEAGEGDDQGEGASGKDSEGQSNGAGTEAGDFKQRAKDALKKAREARNEDKNLSNDLRSFNEALHDTRNHTPLPRVPTTYSNLDGQDMAEAIRCNRSLRLLMEAARAEHAPSWQGGQRTGVLDVIRYKTREPGDMAFFRNVAEGGDMHLPNLSVSVLLDGSGSMQHHVTKLGVAAYAIKTACDACDVPCTVSVFDTRAHLLWDAEDRPMNIPDAFCPLGGTDPTQALEVIDGQMHDKARHLVIIMTDGAWSGWQHKSLDEYAFPNRDVVVLFWNTPPTNIQGLKNIPHAQVDSLMEIPQIVRRYLIQSM